MIPPIQLKLYVAISLVTSRFFFERNTLMKTGLSALCWSGNDLFVLPIHDPTNLTAVQKGYER